MSGKTTSRGWRVGDRIAWCEKFGAVILEIGDNDRCLLRFDDGSEDRHPVGTTSSLSWRRLKSKKITFKKR